MKKLLQIFDDKLKNHPRDKVFGDFVVEINVQEWSRKTKISTRCIYDSLKLLKSVGAINVVRRQRTSISYKIGVYTTKHVDREWIPYQHIRKQLHFIPVNPSQIRTKFLRELQLYDILIKLFVTALDTYLCVDDQDSSLRFARVGNYIKHYGSLLWDFQTNVLDMHKQFRSTLLRTKSFKSIVSNKLYHRITDLDYTLLTRTIENKRFTNFFSVPNNLFLNLNLINLINLRNKEELIKIILDLIKIKEELIKKEVISKPKKSSKSSRINSCITEKHLRYATNQNKVNKIKELQNSLSQKQSQMFGTLRNMLISKNRVFTQMAYQESDVTLFFNKDNQLPKYLCTAFDQVHQLCTGTLTDSKLFSAVFGQYRYLKRGKTPPKYWLGTSEFRMSLYELANAYHMITGFTNKTMPVIDGQSIVDADYSELKRFKKLFIREFARVFGYDPINIGGIHLTFLNEYFLLKGLLTFQTLQTAFEHETHSRMRMLYYIVAQMQYFKDTYKYHPIWLGYLSTLDAQVQAHLYALEWESGDKLSSTEISQLDSYMDTLQQ